MDARASVSSRFVANQAASIERAARAQLFRATTLGCLLALTAGPKLAAVRFINETLWGTIKGSTYLLVCVQELALASVLFAVTLRTLHARSAVFLGWWAVLAVVVSIEALDMRARELWLTPLDPGQVEYALAQLPALRSSVAMFFRGGDVFGLTFKKALVIWAAVLVSGGLSAWRARSIERARAPRDPLGGGSRWWAWLIAAVLLSASSAAVPRQLYAVEQNVWIGPLVRLFTPRPPSSTQRSFEQPLRTFAEALTPPRVRLHDVPAFDNLVIVILESFRYRGHELPENRKIPNLARFAREGLWAKAYVAVPHSSKGLYAIFTGQAPSSGVEIREATFDTLPTLVAELRDRRGAHTSVFSAQYLRFENTDGLLRAAGFDELADPNDLEALIPNDPSVQTSYGIDDAALKAAAARVSAARKSDQPFVTALLTVDAHHPYVHPRKTKLHEDGFEHYTAAIAHTDHVIGEVVKEFQRLGLARDTLFVFVADHGESFGEHGTYIHNNSLFEEEITIPLVLWSEDGRLGCSETLEARQIDVAPTIADLMGLASPRLLTQGVSLLRARQRPPAFVASFFEGVSQALVLDGEKYIYFPSNTRLIRFDLISDPFEQRPRDVTGEERRSVLERLHAARGYEAFVWGASDRASQNSHRRE